MARQLDFSPIDYRQAILADPVGRAMGQGIRETGQAIGQGIREYRQAKQQREADFVDMMKYDTAITGDNVIDNRIAREYNAVKDKATAKFMDRKGRLTPADKIEIQTDLRALDQMSGMLKAVNSQWGKAMQKAVTKDGRNTFDLDNQGWADFMTVVAGDGTVSDIQGFMNQLTQSDTGVPFLNYRIANPDAYLATQIQDFQRATAGDARTVESSDIVDGRRRTTTKTTIPYGSPEDFTEQAIASMMNSPDAPRILKGIEAQMSPEQIAEAESMYGEFPKINYYYRNMKPGYIQDQLKPEVKTKYEDYELAPKGKGGGLWINFGGGKGGPGSVSLKDTKIEGFDVQDYAEFATAGKSLKAVEGAIVENGKALLNGKEVDMIRPETPADYQVLGVSLANDEIYLRRKIGGNVYQTIVAPREGNEHFLDEVMREEDILEMRRRAGKTQAPTDDPLGIL